MPQASTTSDALEDSLMSQALSNIKERRKRLQQSQIFDGSEKKVESYSEKMEDKEVNENLMDLTVLQEKNQQAQFTSVDDDLDILDSYISPLNRDLFTKKMKLKQEIADEKIKIRCKYLFKHGLKEDDPFKLFS